MLTARAIINKLMFMCCTCEFPACLFICELVIFVDCRARLCRMISVWPSFSIYAEILCFMRISLYLGLSLRCMLSLQYDWVFRPSSSVLQNPILSCDLSSFTLFCLFLLSSHSLMWVINEALVGRPSSPYVSGVRQQHVSHTLSVSHSVIHTLVVAF